MPKFTEDNTTGYSVAQLERMNEKYEYMIIMLGVDEIEDDQRRNDLSISISESVCLWMDKIGDSQ